MSDSEFYLDPDKTASFDHTNWFTVKQAGEPASARSDAAKASFCKTYWYPIYFYVRRQGHGPEDAQDLTQEFFARMFEKNYLHTANPDKGKFRSFLLTMLKRFLADEWDRSRRQKRGGGAETISIDAQDTEFRYRNEPADELTPEKAFERRWASNLMEQVLSRLKHECVASGKATVFEELKPFLTCDDDRVPCAEAARKLHITEGNLKVTVHRLRQRYRDLLRAEIAQTVATPEQVEEEVQDLLAAFQ
ncbi:MAG: RNA polymerase subunit sigma-24 [Verrucomicrobia bacterium]|nr:MAG: RNA polymerase subunit sigma-24 [Verrucomicrobiota bacterium]